MWHTAAQYVLAHFGPSFVTQARFLSWASPTATSPSRATNRKDTTANFILDAAALWFLRNWLYAKISLYTLGCDRDELLDTDETFPKNGSPKRRQIFHISTDGVACVCCFVCTYGVPVFPPVTNLERCIAMQRYSTQFFKKTYCRELRGF